MFSQKHRIKKEKEITEIFKNGKKLNSKTVTIKYKKNDHGFGRFAVVISKKTEKYAYKRNTIKRKIRHILKNKAIKKEVDMLCYLYSNEIKKLEKDLLYLLLKIK